METIRSTSSGNRTANSKACMPPIEAPMTSLRRWMLSFFSSRACRVTMSPMVIRGKFGP
jgi:hypothetical protein